MSKRDNSPWKTSLILTTGQRDDLDELATRIRSATDYRPGASELIRAFIDASVDRVRSESFKTLGEAIGILPAREAAVIVERWMHRRLGTCGSCGKGLQDSRDVDPGDETDKRRRP